MMLSLNETEGSYRNSAAQLLQSDHDLSNPTGGIVLWYTKKSPLSVLRVTVNG